MIENTEGGNLHELTLFGGRGCSAAGGVGALQGSQRRGNGLGDLAGHLLGDRDNTMNTKQAAKGQVRQGGWRGESKGGENKEKK